MYASLFVLANVFLWYFYRTIGRRPPTKAHPNINLEFLSILRNKGIRTLKSKNSEIAIRSKPSNSLSASNETNTSSNKHVPKAAVTLV